MYGRRRIRLHAFVTFFKRKNDDTPSYIMDCVILQYQMTSASAHFSRAFKTVALLFDITRFSIGSISEV